MSNTYDDLVSKQITNRSALWSSWLGNLFEHYDTALFSLLSPFLAPLIFPQQDALSALLLTYAMIPLGMIARPLGALYFGYIGDLYGRRQALFLSLGGMALVSAGLSLSPTYEQVGWVAPLFFAVGRIFQNFLASGEVMGGAIFLLENAPEKEHNLISSLYNMSTVGGIFLASIAISLLYAVGLLNPGWRVLYGLGSITALFGCLLRMQTDDSSIVGSRRGLSAPLWKTLWSYRHSFLAILVTSGFSYANYSIALVFLNGFIPLITPWTQAEMMGLNSVMLALDLGMLLVFGWIFSAISSRNLMFFSSCAIALVALPLFFFLENCSFLTLVLIRICFVLLGVTFSAPMHAWVQQLVPASHRYLLLSFGYALGSQLLGGPTTVISLWLYQKTGVVLSASFYWIALALGTGIVIYRNNSQKDAAFKTQLAPLHHP